MASAVALFIFIALRYDAVQFEWQKRVHHTGCMRDRVSWRYILCTDSLS